MTPTSRITFEIFIDLSHLVMIMSTRLSNVCHSCPYYKELNDKRILCRDQIRTLI